MLCFSGVKLSGFHLRSTIGSSQLFFLLEINPPITISTNNRINICSYYVKQRYEKSYVQLLTTS